MSFDTHNFFKTCVQSLWRIFGRLQARCLCCVYVLLMGWAVCSEWAFSNRILQEWCFPNQVNSASTGDGWMHQPRKFHSHSEQFLHFAPFKSVRIKNSVTAESNHSQKNNRGSKPDLYTSNTEKPSKSLFRNSTGRTCPEALHGVAWNGLVTIKNDSELASNGWNWQFSLHTLPTPLPTRPQKA